MQIHKMNVLVILPTLNCESLLADLPQLLQFIAVKRVPNGHKKATGRFHRQRLFYI